MDVGVGQSSKGQWMRSTAPANVHQSAPQKAAVMELSRAASSVAEKSESLRNLKCTRFEGVESNKSIDRSIDQNSKAIWTLTIETRFGCRGRGLFFSSMRRHHHASSLTDQSIHPHLDIPHAQGMEPKENGGAAEQQHSTGQEEEEEEETTVAVSKNHYPDGVSVDR